VEAAAPALAFPCARSAYERGEVDRGDRFAAVVRASGDPVWTTQLDAFLANLQGLDAQEREKRWRAVLAAPINEGQRVWALSQLAGLGCWPLPELDAMAENSLLAPGMYDLLRARALAAQGHPERALALLRAHLGTTSLAAEEYARLLHSLGRVDECVAACDRAGNRFGETRLDLFALDVLTGAGRIDEVLNRGNAFLARPDLPLHLRQEARGKLYDVYVRRRDWSQCERLAGAGLSEVVRVEDDLGAGRVDPLTLPASAGEQLREYRRQYAWMLVINQFNQGDVDRALFTMDDHNPEIRSPVEAGAWADLQRIRGWTPDTAQRALELAQRSDMPATVVGQILFSLIQAVPSPTDGDPAAALPSPLTGPGSSASMQMPAAFHEQLGDLWRTFMQHQGPQRFRPLTGDGDQLLAQLRAMLEPGAARQVLAHQAVWYGQTPVGFISAAAGTPYLLSLVEQRAQILPAVTAAQGVYEHERTCAVGALGQRISVEPTALYLCAAVLDDWATVSVAFSGLLLAEPAAHDILNSHVAARAMTNVAGHLGLNPRGGQLHISETTAAQKAEILRRTSAVHVAAQDCQVVAVADLDTLGTRHPIELVGAFLAPLALAIADGVALYSDDVVLRDLARSRGVPCFGTLALLDALAGERGHVADPAVQLRTLFTHHVVDLPAVAQLILALPQDDYTISDPLLINLARPATWQPYYDNAAAAVAAILTRAHQYDPAAFRDVVTATATGCTAAFTDPETVLALVATVALAYVTDVTPQAAAVVIPAVRHAAASYGLDPTPKIRELLQAVLIDDSDRFQLTPYEARQRIDDVLADL
jgi:hypothetical protein